MFARTVSFHLKPGLAGEFSRLLDQDILPILRKQKGFQDEVSLIAADRAKAVAISLWDLQEHAEAYARADYAKVVKVLDHVMQGSPLVQMYDVASSTLHATVPVRAI